MLAAYSNSSVVEKYLKDEHESSRLVEIQSPLAKVIQTSKLGVIAKKHHPSGEMVIDCGSVITQGSEHQ